MKIQSGTAKWFSDDGTRLDASFHLSEGQVAKMKIGKSPYQIESLSGVTSDIFSGPRFKRFYVSNPERGVPFMGGSDMQKSDLNSLKIISKKLTKALPELALKKGWTLITRSGTIGQTAYVREDFIDKAASEDLIRVVVNDKIKPGYLYAYLSSRYGYALLTQGTYGGVIQHIEPHHIAGLPVPLLPEIEQQRIHDLVEDAAKLRAVANEDLKVAIEEIESKYGLSYEKKMKIFSTPLATILSGDKYTNEIRLEADNYQPRTLKIINRIKQLGNWSLLGDICHKITISDLRYRNFVRKGVPLFTGQALGLLQPDYSKQLSKTLTRNIAENLTKDGDIMISAFGTLGKIELAYKNFYTGIFPSQQIAKVRCNSSMIHPGFVFLFLKSKVGQEQIMKYKTGSVIEWLNSHNVASIVVPIPHDNGERLGEKAYEIILHRELAYQKEKEAIQIIESTISSW